VTEPAGPRPRTLLPWLPPVLWMLVIFGGSSVPGRDIPSGYSVYGHLGEYCILGVLVMLAVRRTWPDWRLRAPALALAIASAYGVTDELHQFLSPGRTPDPTDWAADTIGAAVGIALALAVLAWSRKRARR